MMFGRLHLKLLFEKVTFHSYDYETFLQFFTQVSTTMSSGMVQELQGLASHTFFGNDSHLQPTPM